MPNISRPTGLSRWRRRSCLCWKRPVSKTRFVLLPQSGFAQLVVLVKERTKTLVEMVHWVRPYFGEAVAFDEEAGEKIPDACPSADADQVDERFEALPHFPNPNGKTFKKPVEEEGIKMGQLAQPVRVGLTGRTASPGLF